MREIPVEQAAALIAEQLPKGIFLCVDGDVPNVMTIGWGGLAYYWRKHIYVVPVREQRHTYALLQTAKEFTVCIPHKGELVREVAQAGTLSGRDGDKFAAIGLPKAKAQHANAPIIPGCAVYLECRVLAQNAFTKEQTDPAVTESSYPAGDYHTLFYGEIIACYAGD